jgi:succinate dehydrogenase / fumarate reductase flavoprotein subunit
VARCIVSEIRAGRGSPHGGVFLDIAWIKEKLPGAEEHIKKKLPSMYHQFKQLADIDITREAMEVGPTTHYIMGGVMVDAETQMSTVPGLFAAGESGAGLHGANRLGGNSLSDLLVFGKRAGHFAAAFAKAHGAGTIHPDAVAAAAREALAPFEQDLRGGAAESPYAVQRDLQETMQDLVGIVRREGELVRALGELERLRARAERVRVDGHRQYNPGWHTALALQNLLTVAEAVTRPAIERRESRGAQFRDDHQTQDAALGRVRFVVRKGADGDMQVVARPIPEMRADLRQIVEENR